MSNETGIKIDLKLIINISVKNASETNSPLYICRIITMDSIKIRKIKILQLVSRLFKCKLLALLDRLFQLDINKNACGKLHFEF